MKKKKSTTTDSTKEVDQLYNLLRQIKSLGPNEKLNYDKYDRSQPIRCPNHDHSDVHPSAYYDRKKVSVHGAY